MLIILENINPLLRLNESFKKLNEQVEGPSFLIHYFDAYSDCQLLPLYQIYSAESGEQQLQAFSDGINVANVGILLTNLCDFVSKPENANIVPSFKPYLLHFLMTTYSILRRKIVDGEEKVDSTEASELLEKVERTSLRWIIDIQTYAATNPTAPDLLCNSDSITHEDLAAFLVELSLTERDLLLFMIYLTQNLSNNTHSIAKSFFEAMASNYIINGKYDLLEDAINVSTKPLSEHLFLDNFYKNLSASIESVITKIDKANLSTEGLGHATQGQGATFLPCEKLYDQHKGILPTWASKTGLDNAPLIKADISQIQTLLVDLRQSIGQANPELIQRFISRAIQHCEDPVNTRKLLEAYYQSIDQISPEQIQQDIWKVIRCCEEQTMTILEWLVDINNRATISWLLDFLFDYTTYIHCQKQRHDDLTTKKTLGLISEKQPIPNDPVHKKEVEVLLTNQLKEIINHSFEILIDISSDYSVTENILRQVNSVKNQFAAMLRLLPHDKCDEVMRAFANNCYTQMSSLNVGRGISVRDKSICFLESVKNSLAIDIQQTGLKYLKEHLNLLLNLLNRLIVDMNFDLTSKHYKKNLNTGELILIPYADWVKEALIAAYLIPGPKSVSSEEPPPLFDRVVSTMRSFSQVWGSTEDAAFSNLPTPASALRPATSLSASSLTQPFFSLSNSSSSSSLRSDSASKLDEEDTHSRRPRTGSVPLNQRRRSSNQQPSASLEAGNEYYKNVKKVDNYYNGEKNRKLEGFIPWVAAWEDAKNALVVVFDNSIVATSQDELLPCHNIATSPTSGEVLDPLRLSMDIMKLSPRAIVGETALGTTDLEKIARMDDDFLKTMESSLSQFYLLHDDLLQIERIAVEFRGLKYVENNTDLAEENKTEKDDLSGRILALQKWREQFINIHIKRLESLLKPSLQEYADWDERKSIVQQGEERDNSIQLFAQSNALIPFLIKLLEKKGDLLLIKREALLQKLVEFTRKVVNDDNVNDFAESEQFVNEAIQLTELEEEILLYQHDIKRLSGWITAAAHHSPTGIEYDAALRYMNKEDQEIGVYRSVYKEDIDVLSVAYHQQPSMKQYFDHITHLQKLTLPFSNEGSQYFNAASSEFLNESTKKAIIKKAISYLKFFFDNVFVAENKANECINKGDTALAETKARLNLEAKINESMAAVKNRHLNFQAQRLSLAGFDLSGDDDTQILSCVDNNATEVTTVDSKFSQLIYTIQDGVTNRNEEQTFLSENSSPDNSISSSPQLSVSLPMSLSTSILEESEKEPMWKGVDSFEQVIAKIKNLLQTEEAHLVNKALQLLPNYSRDEDPIEFLMKLSHSELINVIKRLELLHQKEKERCKTFASKMQELCAEHDVQLKFLLALTQELGQAQEDFDRKLQALRDALSQAETRVVELNHAKNAVEEARDELLIQIHGINAMIKKLVDVSSTEGLFEQLQKGCETIYNKIIIQPESNLQKFNGSLQSNIQPKLAKILTDENGTKTLGEVQSILNGISESIKCYYFGTSNDLSEAHLPKFDPAINYLNGLQKLRNSITDLIEVLILYYQLDACNRMAYCNVTSPSRTHSSPALELKKTSSSFFQSGLFSRSMPKLDEQNELAIVSILHPARLQVITLHYVATLQRGNLRLWSSSVKNLVVFWGGENKPKMVLPNGVTINEAFFGIELGKMQQEFAAMLGLPTEIFITQESSLISSSSCSEFGNGARSSSSSSSSSESRLPAVPLSASDSSISRRHSLRRSAGFHSSKSAPETRAVTPDSSTAQSPDCGSTVRNSPST